MITPDAMATSAGEQRANSDLAALRRAKGLTLEEISGATGIGMRYLEAIEAEDFARLPSGVYAVSYIRQYARAIGFDASAALQRYLAQMPQPKTPPATPLQAPARRWRPQVALRHLLDHVAHRGRSQHTA